MLMYDSVVEFDFLYAIMEGVEGSTMERIKPEQLGPKTRMIRIPCRSKLTCLVNEVPQWKISVQKNTDTFISASYIFGMDVRFEFDPVPDWVECKTIASL